MAETFSQTVQIQAWIDRLVAGDRSARDQLLNCACERLVRLTRKLLRNFPEVRRWEQTDDVFQNASLRLCRALEAVQPKDVQHFFRLAALQIRRELIDLARHYKGPQGLAANYVSRVRLREDGSCDGGELEVPQATQDPRKLAGWAEFHEQAGALPDEEREVFDLLWYHGLSQEEAASVLGVNVRTVKRRWRSARVLLYEALGGDELPL